MARRIVHQLKIGGSLLPGAPDLLFLWDGGCGCMELKRPAERTLIGKQRAGELSDDQKRFQALCRRWEVPYEVVMSWPQARELLKRWGRLPEGWMEPDARRAA